MFKKFSLLVAAIACMAATRTYAQEMKPCGSDQMYWELLKQYPQLADMEAEFNEQITKELQLRTTAATDTYDIPVVVHVIHDYGAENIGDNAIYTAVNNWTTVYMRRNADTMDVIAPFKGLIGNAQMRFHLATKDPSGNPTKGIVRVQSYLTGKASDQAKYDQWPRDKYINIYIINAFGAASAGAAAYAYTPGSASFIPQYDGIITLYNYTDYEKTIPHELGHVLNLSHVWGSTNNPGVSCGGSDGVSDTPPTKGHNPSGCTAASLYDVTCSTPDTNNAQNIMDYTYCSRMFTPGQCNRMRTALTGTASSRNNLITSANLNATGALLPMPDLAPTADYIVNKASFTGVITDTRSYFLTINNDAQFSFRNWSWNDTVSSVAWTFSNGASTPTSTNMSSPVYTKFSTPGWVTVSLTATSNAGSNTITNTHAVYAADTTPVGGLGYTQDFASAASVDNWPMINFYNNSFKWEYFATAGYDDGSCVRFRSFDPSAKRFGDPVGDHDDFYTPAFNIPSIGTAPFYLNFFTAAANITASGLPSNVTAKGDSFQVDVTTTGGQRWTKIAAFNGNDLANNGVKSGEFTPTTASQWKKRAVKVDPAYQTSNTFFRFRYWPGNTGNNLYLDKVSIDQWPNGVQETIASSDMFSIFPNPTNSGFNLLFKTGNDGVVNYSIRDITGKMVYEHKVVLTPNSVQQESVSHSVTPSAGMYLITVVIDGVSKTQKLVVY